MSEQRERETPRTYVSVSTTQRDGKRRWRVIHQGMPLCADRNTALEAFRVYEEFMLREVTSRSMGTKTFDVAPLWDGDRAEWDQLCKM